MLDPIGCSAYVPINRTAAFILLVLTNRGCTAMVLVQSNLAAIFVRLVLTGRGCTAMVLVVEHLFKPIGRLHLSSFLQLGSLVLIPIMLLVVLFMIPTSV